MGGLKSPSLAHCRRCRQSHPTRDGWIEIGIMDWCEGIEFRPIPHGMGGLKFGSARVKCEHCPSHPTRDGWIEIGYILLTLTSTVTSPIPHGMGGLKLSDARRRNHGAESPIPHGMGGLKYHCRKRVLIHDSSHPTRDGWIEIPVA